MGGLLFLGGHVYLRFILLGVETACEDAAGIYYRDHRTGWVVPGGAAAGEGVRGAWDDPPGELVQYRADRPPVPRPAPGERAAVPALRGSDRFEQPEPAAGEDRSRRDL